jgi:hypothetical protein
MVLGLKERLPGYPATGLGETLAVGGSPEPLQPSKPKQPEEPEGPEEPEEPGKPFEPLFMAKIATPTMAAITRPPTRSIAGLAVLLAGAAVAVGGGIAQAGCTGAI